MAKCTEQRCEQSMTRSGKYKLRRVVEPRIHLCYGVRKLSKADARCDRGKCLDAGLIRIWNGV